MAQPFTLLQLALVLGRPVWWSRAVIGGCDCSVRFMLPPGVVHTSSSTLSHRTVVPVSQSSQSSRRRKTRSAFAWHARTPTGSERLASGQHATLCSFHLCPSSLLPFFVRGKCRLHDSRVAAVGLVQKISTPQPNRDPVACSRKLVTALLSPFGIHLIHTHIHLLTPSLTRAMRSANMSGAVDHSSPSDPLTLLSWKLCRLRALCLSVPPPGTHCCAD
jgi:hypothetical protein